MIVKKSTGPERHEVEQKVRMLLAEALHRDVEEIGLDDRLQEDLGAESIDLMTLVFELEDAFGRELSDEQLAQLTTVRSVVDLLTTEADASVAGG